MATIDRYRIDIDTQGANSALNSLRGTIAGIGVALAGAFSVRELITVTSRFQDLRTSLRAVYRDVEQGNAAFEQIKDFASSSVFSVQDLTEAVIKLKSAGLNPTISQMRLFADVSSVAADSVGALQAITDLYARTSAGGLGLEELNRLADRGIPVFQILADRAGIARTEISEIGKTAQGAQAILRVLEEGLTEMFGGASAARAGNLSQAISNLRDAFDNMLDTIGTSGFSQALTDIINGITEFIGKNQDLIVTIGQGLGTALRFAAENAKYMAAVLAGAFAAAVAGRIIAIAQAVATFAAQLRAAATAGAVLQGVTGVGLVKLAAGVAAAAGVVATINELTSDTSNNLDQIQQDLERIQDGPLSDVGAPAAQSMEQALAALRELSAGTTNLTTSTQKYFGEYEQGVNAFIENIRLQRESIGLTQEQIEYQDTIRRFQEQYRNQIRDLQLELAKLNEKPEENAQLIQLVNDAIARTNELYEQQRGTVESIAEQIRQQRIEQEAAQRAAEAVLEAQETSADFLRSMRESTEDVARSIRQMNMSQLEKQIDDITFKIRRDLAGEIRRLEALKVNITDPQAIRAIDAEIAKITESANAAIRQQTRLTTESYRQQRSFAQGWRDAFRQYADEATNSARIAAEVFEKTTRGLEDALVNFVKTGKFEWKSFVNDIVDTLLRSQIRKLIADIFAPTGALGGIGELFGLGDLFGGSDERGKSASNPLYVLDVGNLRTGGSPFGGTPGGISIGGTGSGNATSGILGNVISGISSTVSNVVSGIKNIFGGFFANGGFLPAGKIGIVGERGPEMISGPANITPMMGANVTLNINAVDAPSFQALVASDPSFIAAVAQQGLRAVPGRR